MSLLAAALVGGVLPWCVRRPTRGRDAPLEPRDGLAGDARAPGPASASLRAASVDARGGPVALDVVLLLELVETAVASGAPVPRALRAVGGAVAGDAGRALADAGAALVLGASWSAAWAGAPAGVGEVRDALEDAWRTGAAAGPALRGRAAAIRRHRRRRARIAGAALGVRLVLPLGLCFLPAFVLLGLVPLVLGLGSGLLDGVLP